jgi:hypothetical protein
LIAGAILAGFACWVIIAVIRDRRCLRRLADTRPPLSDDQFIGQLVANGIEHAVARFVWDEFQPYYYAPLTPYPNDRPISGMRIDPDDLSDIEKRFEKHFKRRWGGKWIGSHDPTLIEFAHGLWDSTAEN